jgi:hypothetical protein
LALPFFAPDAAHHHNGSFFKIATATSWHRPLDLPAAWCSLKIILSSIGLFLVIESFGSMLARSKHPDLAMAVFSMQFLSVLVFLMGNYYLVKALF